MLESIIRPDLLDCEPYQKTPVPADLLPLHLNESPFSRSLPLCEFALNRYPLDISILTKSMANFYGVTENQVISTAGSDEGINLLIRLCCRAGVDSILINTPTFPMYADYAKIQGAQLICVPLIEAQNFALDVEAIRNSLQPTTKLVFICSPNNPTGTIVNREDIIAIAIFAKNALVVIDEAYVEFSEEGSLIPLIETYPNIVILRTLSKAHALAGIRFGALIGNEILVKHVSGISSPFPIAATTYEAALMAYSPEQWKQTQNEIALIQSERNRIVKLCQNFPIFTKVYNTQANFIYCRCPTAIDFAKRCATEGIIIKYTPDTVRITITTPDLNQRWISLC